MMTEKKQVLRTGQKTTTLDVRDSQHNLPIGDINSNAFTERPTTRDYEMPETLDEDSRIDDILSMLETLDSDNMAVLFMKAIRLNPEFSVALMDFCPTAVEIMSIDDLKTMYRELDGDKFHNLFLVFISVIKERYKIFSDLETFEEKRVTGEIIKSLRSYENGYSKSNVTLRLIEAGVLFLYRKAMKE